MSKNLTYKQRIVRIASIGIVAFILMWIGVGFAKLAGVDDYNTQQVLAFFILACGAVWLFAILSALISMLENWILKKIEHMKKDVE